jgi:hypothetical protein
VSLFDQRQIDVMTFNFQNFEQTPIIAGAIFGSTHNIAFVFLSTELKNP